MSEKVIRNSMSHSLVFHWTALTAMPAAGLVQLAASVILLSSAWPLTKIALSLGSTPLWFAEGRTVLSGLTIAAVLALRRHLAPAASGRSASAAGGRRVPARRLLRPGA